MEILKYKYNEKEFVAYLNNNKINFGIKIDENNISNELTQKEEFIIKSIYNFIVGDKKDLVKLSNINVKNKEFNVFYNTKNNLYSFKEVNPQDIDNTQILEELNYAFNNQSAYLYSEKEETRKKFFEIIMKVGATAITGFILGAAPLNILEPVLNNSTTFKINYMANSIYKNAVTPEKSNYSIERIFKIIDNNEKLTLEEKKFVKKLRVEIEENREYIDFEQIERNLAELDIEYPSNVEEKGNIKITGNYCLMGSERNKINVFNEYKYISGNIENCNKTTLIHELNHLLTRRGFWKNVPGETGDMLGDIYCDIGIKNEIFEEMVNELFSREYKFTGLENIRNTAYRDFMPVMYSLCEILNEKTLREYKFSGNIYGVVQEITDLGVDIETVYELFKSLNLTSYLLQQEKLENEYYKNNQKIYGIIKEIYEKKHRSPMENDKNILLYFYGTDYVDEEFNQKVRDTFGVETIEEVIPKGYISQKQKILRPNITAIIDRETDEKMTIFNANRYILNRNEAKKISEDMER